MRIRSRKQKSRLLGKLRAYRKITKELRWLVETQLGKGKIE